MISLAEASLPARRSAAAIGSSAPRGAEIDDWTASDGGARCSRSAGAEDATTASRTLTTHTSTSRVNHLKELRGRSRHLLRPSAGRDGGGLCQKVDLPEDTMLVLENSSAGERRKPDEMLLRGARGPHLRRPLPRRGPTFGVRFANRVVEPLWADRLASGAWCASSPSRSRTARLTTVRARWTRLQSHLLQVSYDETRRPPSATTICWMPKTAVRATRIWEAQPRALLSRRAQQAPRNVGDREIPPRTSTSRGLYRRGRPRPSPRSRARSVPRGGRMCRSRCAPARRSCPTPPVVVVFREGEDRADRRHPAGWLGPSLGPDAMSLELNVNGGDDPFALLHPGHRSGAHTGLHRGAERAAPTATRPCRWAPRPPRSADQPCADG